MEQAEGTPKKGSPGFLLLFSAILSRGYLHPVP